MKPLQAYLTEVGARVDERLSDLLPRDNLAYSELFYSARYSLLANGKRLRPILAIATAEMLGCDVEIALTPACALEMVHTYSLIHDDLPSMDNADVRRGQPALHKKIPEGQAILVGDYLLTYAFEILALAPELSAEQRLTLIEILSSRSGGHGMIGGQVLDLASTGETIDLDTLETMHALKTGALITASLEFGGVLGESDESTMAALQTIGEAIGLAYQIVDDILDATQPASELGKPAGQDEDKCNYVALLGIAQAHETAEILKLTAHDAIDSLPGDPTLLLQLADLITDRQS